LRQAGLPVPDGFCITTDSYDFYAQNGILPSGLISQIEAIRDQLGGKVAIRSSANCEDGRELSMAGVFQSYYVSEEDDIESVVKRIYDHARSLEVVEFMSLHGLTSSEVKMGLVIQRLVNPERAGVIYTGINGGYLLIQYVEGLGSRLVDGETHGSAILLDKDGYIVASTGFEARPISVNIIKQIRNSAETIVDLYGGEPQDIEFACVGEQLYILQTRRLTADLGRVEIEETPEECLERTKLKLQQLAAQEKKELGTEKVIFSDANFSELLPRPTEMDFGIFAYIFTGSDGIPGGIQLGRMQMGYLLGEESIGFMSYIGGRPYFSIARDAATFYAGFPDTIQKYFSTLVREYLEAIQFDPSKGAYPEMGLYLQDPTFEDLETRFGGKASTYLQVYQDFVVGIRRHADNFLNQFRTREFPEMTTFVREMRVVDINEMTNEELVGYCTNILEHLRTRSCVNFVKSARLGFYYSQRLQSLLRERLGLGSDEVEKVFARLSQGLDGSAITEVNLAIADAKTEEEAVDIANKSIWHFSTSEMLEIRHPRLKDDPVALIAYVRGIRQSGQYRKEFERQKAERLFIQQDILEKLSGRGKQELEEVIQSTQTYMALRETIKYLFTQEYSLLRDALQILGSRLGLEDGDIYFIYPRELSNLIAEPRSFTHLIRSRKESFLNYKKLDLPHVIRESDIESLKLSSEGDNDFVELKGKFLSEGPQVEGVVINLDQFENIDQASEEIRKHGKKGIPIILVAKQINLGHDPFIALASGLVIENAGIVSHGAQRARELGRGAIGGVNTGRLKNGMRVVLDPVNKLVRKVG
jgi:phosphohistidine swiveling domain-containing protein